MESPSIARKLTKVKIRTKIIVPVIVILVLSNLISVFTSAYKMDDLAKTNAKEALHQLTDSIFLNLRTAMNTGDSTVIEDAENKSRENIQGLEKFVVARSKDMIELFSPHLAYTDDPIIHEVFESKKSKIIESKDNNKHTLRSLRPMIATQECLYCHVNQQKGDVIGVMDLTFNLKESDQIINSAVINLIIQALIVLVVVTIFMAWLIRSATKPIDVFQRGLEKFFRFIRKEEDNAGHINGYSNDEIGELVESVNRNIDQTVAGVIKDEAVIKETKDVCTKASLGNFDVHIKAQGHSPEINELRDIINKLIDAVGYNINRVEKVLSAFDENNYVPRIQSKGKTAGSMKAVFDKVDALGQSLTQSAWNNYDNGNLLNEDAKQLKESIGNVKIYLDSQQDNVQNSALELDEIMTTSNQTSQSATSMQSYATNVSQSVTQGEKLANKTGQEMKEIAQQVAAINDAIAIIDQISFQTNILSLNAAVEASTAGEAGKGFAVVANEVRNLANKSAEAARDIKDLVQAAKDKTTEGEQISQEMISGYNELNEHIESTLDLIGDVAKASQKQNGSIEHVTHNINSLKNSIEKSAQMVEDADTVALKTSEMANKILAQANEKKFMK